MWKVEAVEQLLFKVGTMKIKKKIKSAIQEKISKQYEVKIPNSTGLNIKIIGMSFDYSENVLIEKLRKQNPKLADANIKFMGKYETKRGNKTLFNVKLRVDNEAYGKIMEERKVNVGWERCRVYDGTELVQCMKCRGYNHIAKECKNQEICLKCHGQHKTVNSESQEKIMKYINCSKINSRLNMGLDENHFTNDRECPVYQNKLRNKMRNIGLTI